MPRPTDVSETGERLYEELEPLALEDEANDWALLVLCGAFGLQWQPITDLTGDAEDGTPGWGSLLDIDNCPDRYLPHLGMYVGTRLDGITDPVTQREAVRSHNNFQRGTRAALIAEVQETLTGTQTVRVLERNEGAYRLTVITDPTETPDETATLAAILRQKPGGIVLEYYTSVGTTIDELVGEIYVQAGTINGL